MAFKDIPTSAGKEFEPIPEGMHVARCYSIIDLGTQEIEWEGEKKLQRKIYVTFEIPSIMKEFKEGEGEKPQVIGKKYTLSFHENARLTRDLTSWLSSKKLEGDMAYWLDEYVVGTECMLNVIHNVYKEKTYANIETITPLPTSIKCPKQINPSMNFDLQVFDAKKYAILPEWIQKIIVESPEYGYLVSGEANEADVGFETKKSVADDEVKESDLPF